jgi:ElaA protein
MVTIAILSKRLRILSSALKAEEGSLIEFRWYRFDEFDSQELYAMLALRQEILVVEQQSPYSDLDFADQTASHLLAKLGADFVAYARCTWPSEETAFASFGRVVVSKHYRGTGLGKELVQRSLARLGEESCDIVIGAQLYLEKFYSDFGFVRDGEPYDDVGVPHLRMRLRSRGAPL